MRYTARILILLALMAVSETLPFSAKYAQNKNAESPELQSGYFEGDMVLSAEQQQLLNNNNTNSNIKRPLKPMPRNGLVSTRYLWPNRIITYRIASEFSRAQADVIQQAMAHIASRTCLRFQPAAATSKAYVYIMLQSSGGCSSSVGYQARLQYVYLQPACVQFGTVVHELIHTVGFYHEQSAAERDLYVRIRLDNVLAGKEHNFVKYPAGVVSSYGIGYDYASIMHYGRTAFSRNGMDTIEAVQADGSRLMGQRIGLSTKDALKINRMYGC